MNVVDTSEHCMVNIRGIDRKTLLKALWSNSKPSAFFYNPILSPPLSNEELEEASKRDYVDYLCGRVIKVDLSCEYVDPIPYNRTNGSRALQQVVKKVTRGRRGYNGLSPCKFSPWGDEVIPGDSGTVMCSKCGYWKVQHFTD